MQKTVAFSCVILAFTIFGCNRPASAPDALVKENDSLKQVIEQMIRAKDSAKTPKLPETDSKANIDSNSLSVLRPGRHDFTLQWISWEKPGTVLITPEKGGWYKIKGKQKGSNSPDSITIDGRIRVISAKELLFDGEVVSYVSSNNGGLPCRKAGEFLFKSTLNRKYWRMQDMINCEGGMLTDYVDIYF